MTENRAKKLVFVYANRLRPDRDGFPEIARGYGGAGLVRREFIVNAPGVASDDVCYEVVQHRINEILATMKPDEEIRVVLAGYSPLVAILHDVSREMGMEECYFIRSTSTHKFEERRLKHIKTTEQDL